MTAENENGASRQRPQPTILIVEDSPVQGELLRRALEQAGYQVIAARNGAEGLAAAKEHHPDLVVSDVNMPVMDGYRMCEAFRHEPALKTTPVILLTMLSDAEDVVLGLKVGADAYLTKPYNIPSLLSRVESLLAHPPVPPPEEERRRVSIRLAGHTHTVDAHGPRILSLLVSTYENAVLQNRELAATQQALEDLNQHLEQKVLEKTAELHRLNRALSTINACNEALIRSTDEAQLLDEVSTLLVRQGGFSRAWVAEFTGEGQAYRQLAHAGTDGDYMAAIDARTDRSAAGGAPLADIARSSGRAVIVNDIANDPIFPRWRDEALKRGFASNIVLPLIANGKPFGVLSIYANETGVFDDAEVKLLTELAGDLAYGIVARRTRIERDEALRERQAQQERLRRSLEDSVEAVAATVEARDQYTAGHQRRVADLAVAIAQRLGLDREQLAGIRLGGIVHDLGKIHIPAEILSKPGKLTKIEFDLIKAHPQSGYEILKGIEFPWPIAQMVLQHHERLDGSGYPQGLKGEAIIFPARILAVADVVEAMASHRPYRPGRGIDKAIEEISAGRGKHYEPAIVDACVSLFKETGYELPR